ncbi:MAG: neutral/alkaline non-lysosomal ceramidase N-terminal domain-containing protein [Thermodesulfobacteriota bacterium]
MRRFSKCVPVLVAVLAVFITACAPRLQQIRIDRPAPLTAASPAGGLRAGLARVDITPPPGIATAGYSLMAEVCRGFRTRLYARAVYIQDDDGREVALVSCDLLSGSRLLHHRVAELAGPVTGIEAHELMVAGTHTHSGPGNYFSSNFYNDFAGGKSGFDPRIFDFLARRIADAVIAAHANRRPAKIALGRAEIYGMTRNRSMEPYTANTGLPSGTTGDPMKAVNPVMTMIRIDQKDDGGAWHPAGAFSTFSIHPTAVPHWNDLYTADVFGYIARELEFELEHRHAAPWPVVHAAVNGTHGDNSPGYEKGKQGYAEAKRVGMAVGRRAVDLFDSLEPALSDTLSVRSAGREVDVFERPAINGVSVCDRPVVGNALTAGADDGKHPILYRTPFFREGWGTARWFFTGSCQGAKRHVGGIFQPLVLKKENFPHIMFFQLIQVGDTVFVPMPFEVTCRSGKTMADHVADALGEKAGHVAVISCANDYFGYATTTEEYALQHYEGGHTLYGPSTTPFLAAHAAALALAMDEGRVEDLPASWSEALKVKSFFPEKQAPEGKREARGPVRYHGPRDGEDAFGFGWRDVPPSMIDFDRPLVRVETSPDGKTWQLLCDADGRPADDTGYDVSVAFKKMADGHMGIYEARWYNPPVETHGAYYRFAVLPRGDFDPLYSEPFQADGKRE